MFTNNEIKAETVDHSNQLQQAQSQLQQAKLTKRTRSSRPATVNQLLSSNNNNVATPVTVTTTQVTQTLPTVKQITPIMKLTNNNDHPTITLVNSTNHNNSNNENENNTTIASTNNSFNGSNFKVFKCNKPLNEQSGSGSGISTIYIKHQGNNTNLYVPSTTSQQQNEIQNSTNSSQIIRNCLKSPSYITNANTTTILKPLIINASVAQSTQQQQMGNASIITPTVSTKSVQIVTSKTAVTPSTLANKHTDSIADL